MDSCFRRNDNGVDVLSDLHSIKIQYPADNLHFILTADSFNLSPLVPRIAFHQNARRYSGERS